MKFNIIFFKHEIDEVQFWLLVCMFDRFSKFDLLFIDEFLVMVYLVQDHF